MPTERRFDPLAAGQTIPNIINGSIYETMTRRTRIIIASRSSDPTAAATGTNIGVQFGSRTMALLSQTVTPGTAVGLNASPQIPDDVVVDDVAMPGERIVISLQSRGGVNTNTTIVSFTEM